VAAVFDLGGVVLEVCVERTVRAWAESVGLEAEEVEARLGGKVLPEGFDRGELVLEELREEVCARLGRAMTRGDFERGWNALLGEPFPGVEGLLAELAGTMRLVLLTNTNETHERQWRKSCAAVLPRFERVFTSWRMGVRKPEPEAFEQVLGYLGLSPTRVLFFDDHSENVEAAARLGMVARRVRGPGEVARELELLSLS